jgi:hypothetical protein
MDLCPHKKRLCSERDIHERLGVTLVEDKFVQYRLRWFGHIQERHAKALVRSGVISWAANGKICKGRSNLVYEFVKRDLKDWSINK